MKGLIAHIKKNHSWFPPLSETDNLIQQFEESQNFTLPADVKEFYQRCGRAVLFGDAYIILPLPEICRVSLLQAGEDSEDWCPASWYAFCGVNDGNYVGIDLASSDGQTFNILDCYHEDIGEADIIARSFSEFLHRALSSAGELYWFEESFQKYGRVEYKPPLSYYRRVDASWYKSLGLENGPEKCRHEGCERKRIELSVMCRQHHYEMVKGIVCPFDD